MPAPKPTQGAHPAPACSLRGLGRGEVGCMPGSLRPPPLALCRVGALPRAPVLGRPWPPPLPTRPMPLGGLGTLQPVGPSRTSCALWSPEPPECDAPPPLSSPHSEMPGSRLAQWQDFGCGGPVTWLGNTTPSASVPAKSSVFSTKHTLRWGWLSAFPGRSPRGTGSSSKAGVGCVQPQVGPCPPVRGLAPA